MSFIILSLKYYSDYMISWIKIKWKFYLGQYGIEPHFYMIWTFCFLGTYCIIRYITLIKLSKDNSRFSTVWKYLTSPCLGISIFLIVSFENLIYWNINLTKTILIYRKYNNLYEIICVQVKLEWILQSKICLILF